MERLLAYEGPVVHVDHAHRAPAPTSWSNREEIEKERQECDHTVAELHNNYTLAAERDAEEIVELKKALRVQEKELVKASYQITQLTESERMRSALINQYFNEVTKLKDELAEDNKNYTKLLQGVSNEAKSKFLAARAMAVLEVKEDPEALQYVQWMQEKLADLLGS